MRIAGIDDVLTGIEILSFTDGSVEIDGTAGGIRGTPAGDTISGTATADTIDGLGGNDVSIRLRRR